MISKNILLSLISLLMLTSCGQHIDYIQSYYYNQKYRYYMNKKEYEKAQTAELAAKENLQEHFELDSNLGIVFNLLSKNDEAEKSFEAALKVIPHQFPKDEFGQKEAQFVTNFNRGVFYQSQSKVDQALAAYQAALDIVPTSMETKTNIELLIQKQKEDQKSKESQKKKDQQNKDGQGQGQGEDQNKDQKDQDKKDGQDKDDQKEKPGQKKETKQSPKYQPRPFKGDQLSEGDVKKILGELSQQDKKIRSNFEKKEKNEKGVEGKNEKDW